MSKTSSESALICYPKLKWIKNAVRNEAAYLGVSESKLISDALENRYFCYDSKRLEELKKDVPSK